MKPAPRAKAVVADVAAVVAVIVAAAEPAVVAIAVVAVVAVSAVNRPAVIDSRFFLKRGASREALFEYLLLWPRVLLPFFSPQHHKHKATQ